MIFEKKLKQLYRTNDFRIVKKFAFFPVSLGVPSEGIASYNPDIEEPRKIVWLQSYYTFERYSNWRNFFGFEVDFVATNFKEIFKRVSEYQNYIERDFTKENLKKKYPKELRGE